MVLIPGLSHTEKFKELVRKHIREVLFLSGDKALNTARMSEAPAHCPPPSLLFTVKLHHKMLLSLAVTVNAPVAVDFP